MSRFGNYLRATQEELKHVSWPTRTQALVYTALVIVICALTAVFLGVFDYLFGTLLNSIV